METAIDNDKSLCVFFCEILFLRCSICWLSFFLWWKSPKIPLESPPTMISMYWIWKYACLDFPGEGILFGYTFPNRLTEKTLVIQVVHLQPFGHVGFYYGSHNVTALYNVTVTAKPHTNIEKPFPFSEVLKWMTCQ